jgi:hypothetical protein
MNHIPAHKKFILPGDKFKSTRETRHFHRDSIYEVSACYSGGEAIVIMIRDKNGYDVPLRYFDSDFEPTAATVKAMDLRQSRALLDFYWENPNAPFMLIPGHFYDWTRNTQFDVSRAHFISDEKCLAQIRPFKRDPEVNRYEYDDANSKRIYNKDEFYAYFESLPRYDGHFKMIGMHGGAMDALAFLMFKNLHNFPVYDPNFPSSNTIEYDDMHRIPHRDKDMTFDDLLKLAAEAFDTEVDQNVKNVVHDIMEAFELLPRSFGCTAVTKLLRNGGKAKNQTVEHLAAKYPSILKQGSMFELVNTVDSFLYSKDVFKTKEEYGSGKEDEWRGAFEFIGNKFIDKVQLKAFKNACKA